MVGLLPGLLLLVLVAAAPGAMAGCGGGVQVSLVVAMELAGSIA